MEDGVGKKKSLLIKNMKMNKISDTVLGPSEQLQWFSLHLIRTSFN